MLRMRSPSLQGFLIVTSNRGCCLMYAGSVCGNRSWRYAEVMSRSSSVQLREVAMATRIITVVLSAIYVVTCSGS